MAAAAFNNSGFPMSRVKRKQLTDSDFSLSSPARKIRRLDAGDLPPIMEEVEEAAAATSSGGSGSGGSGWNSDEEGAIVVYKPPVNTQQMLIHRSHASNYYIGSDFISGFKNHFMRPSGSSVTIKSLEEEEEEEEESTSNARSNMAVVPWVPCNVNVADTIEADAMEAEEDGVATMDIEENQSGDGYDSGKGFPQWQQQHCFVPNLPYNTSTPISWFR